MTLLPYGRACARVAGKVVALAAVFSVGVWWTVAYAHGGVADVHVQDVQPGEGSVLYRVHGAWEDGDPIEDGQVTATATSPSGEQQTPVTMQHTQGGIYEGTVQTPDAGDWTLLFTLIHPDAGEPATSTETFTMEAPPPTTSTTQPPPETTAPPVAEVEGTEAAAEEAQPGGEGTDNVSLILVAAAALVAGAVIGAVFGAAVGGRKRYEDDDWDDRRPPERETVRTGAPTWP